MFEVADLVALPTPPPHPLPTHTYTHTHTHTHTHTSSSVFVGLLSVRTVITLQKAIKLLFFLEVNSGMNLLWILHNYDKLYM